MEYDVFCVIIRMKSLITRVLIALIIKFLLLAVFVFLLLCRPSSPRMRQIKIGNRERWRSSASIEINRLKLIVSDAASTLSTIEPRLKCSSIKILIPSLPRPQTVDLLVLPQCFPDLIGENALLLLT